MPHSKKQALYNTNEKIPENMKCPVCFELLLPPIYQCEVGHNICHSCIENVQQCPLCKGDYGDTRNYFAEELVNTSTFPCKYEEFGCTELFHGSELKAHQDGCNYQPYRCPELACKEISGFSQMNSHLERHGFKVIVGQTQLATMEVQDSHFDKKTEYNPWRISAFYREFYAVTARQKEGFWYFWTWILALPEEAKKYSAEISLICDKKDVVYRGPVHSLRVSPEDIIKGGNCLIVGDNLIKSLRQNGQITCGIRFIHGKNWISKKVKVAKKAVLRIEKQASKNIQKISNDTTDATPRPTTGNGRKTAVVPFAQKLLKTVLSVKQATGNESTNEQRPSTSAGAGARPKTVGLKVSEMTSKGLLKTKTSKSEDSRPKTATATTAIEAGVGSSTPKKIRKPLAQGEDSELIKKLQQSLQCPGCLQVITPPVFQCSIGHNICGKCKESRADCPLCRAPVESTRNFFAEELLYTAYQKCQFHASGCKVCLPYVSIRQHEVVCEYAPFECPFDTCYQRFSGKELLRHLMIHRLGFAQQGIIVDVSFPKPPANPASALCAIPSIIQYNNIGFYPMIYREKDGSWSFWVSSHDHRKYEYEVVLRKQFRSLVFHGRIASLRMTHHQIKASGNCLITHERLMKTMKNANGKFEIQVRVICRAEGKSKLSESFEFPLFFEVSGTGTTKPGKDKEPMKLFASTKTPENASDDSDEDSLEQFLERVLHTNSDADEGNDRQEPPSFVQVNGRASSTFSRRVSRSRSSLRSRTGTGTSARNSQLNVSSSETSHEGTLPTPTPESCSESCPELEVDADAYDTDAAFPSPPQNSMTDIAVLTDTLLTCESNSMFLKQKYREEHLQIIQKMRLFMEYVGEELARPPEARTSEEEMIVGKILRSLQRVNDEVAQLEEDPFQSRSSHSRKRHTSPVLRRIEKVRQSEDIEDCNEECPTQRLLTDACNKLWQTESPDNSALKSKKSCLKIASTDSLTDCLPKSPLRVKFADEVPQENGNENDGVLEQAEETSPQAIENDSELPAAVAAEALAFPPLETAHAGTDVTASWSAECDLMPAQAQTKSRGKRNKRKGKGKKQLRLAKKQAQVSIMEQQQLQQQADDANNNCAATEPDPEGKSDSGNVGVIEQSLVDENNNALALREQKSDSSLKAEAKTELSLLPLLTDLENVGAPAFQAVAEECIVLACLEESSAISNYTKIEQGILVAENYILPGQKSDSSLTEQVKVKTKLSPLLIDLDGDESVETAAEEYVGFPCPEEFSMTSVYTKQISTIADDINEDEDHEENESITQDLNDNDESLHSLCLAHGLRKQQSQGPHLNQPEIESQAVPQIPELREDDETFLDLNQAYQVRGSLMQIGADPAQENDEEQLQTEAPAKAGWGSVLTEYDFGEPEPEPNDGDYDAASSFTLTISKSIGNLAEGIYTSARDAVSTLFPGFDESNSEEEFDEVQ